MSNKEVKFYKNPERNKPETRQPYVPQYVIEGIEPTEFKSALAPNANIKPELSEDNPRTRVPSMRQPYAEAVSSPIGRGRGPVPNVGNNMEHTWSSVDGEIIDDISGEVIDNNHPMIDNNEYVSSTALGFSENSVPVNVELPVAVKYPSTATDELSEAISSLQEDEYLILVDGVPICAGSLKGIEQQVSKLVFGDHELCSGVPVSEDTIMVVKRVPLRVGVFLG
jgi:hypothetical protein